MVIIRLMGGLGNQMFQYALFESMRQKGKDVYIDLSWYDKNIAHNGIELGRAFGIDLNAFQADINDCKKLGYISTSSISRLYQRLLGKSTFVEEYGSDVVIYKKEILRMDNVYLSGYWQSYKYFSDIYGQIKNVFSFNIENENTEDIINELKCTDSVSVHIRRGDYLGKSLYSNICTHDYYKTAMRYMKNVIDNPKFFIFSDDGEWCRNDELFNDKDCKIVDLNKDEKSYIDMYFMSLCKNHILANSSFSWWGAYLSDNTSGVTIAPKYWINREVCFDDILLSKWKRIGG